MNESVVQAIITNICDKNKPLHAASKNVVSFDYRLERVILY